MSHVGKSSNGSVPYADRARVLYVVSTKQSLADPSQDQPDAHFSCRISTERSGGGCVFAAVVSARADESGSKNRCRSTTAERFIADTIPINSLRISSRRRTRTRLETLSLSCRCAVRKSSGSLSARAPTRSETRPRPARGNRRREMALWKSIADPRDRTLKAPIADTITRPSSRRNSRQSARGSERTSFPAGPERAARGPTASGRRLARIGKLHNLYVVKDTAPRQCGRRARPSASLEDYADLVVDAETLPLDMVVERVAGDVPTGICSPRNGARTNAGATPSTPR